MTALPHVGPYMLHRRIAKGGMAEVYLASREEPEGVHVVALKCIRPEFADEPSFSRMFLDEARITAGLHHPNITRLLDFGEEDGRPYLVMEFVAGASAKQLIKQGALPTDLAIQVGIGVADALHAAHDKRDASGQPLGIVHRDVTPQNVMVTFDGRVKLLDFGIALARVRAERTRTGVLKGKWAYMSPEQVQGRPLDRRSDVFSLGALLFEMIAGRRAFDGASPSEVLGGVMLREPPPLQSFAPGVGDGVVQVVSRCLAKAPEERYQDAIDVAEALRPLSPTMATDGRVEALGKYVLAVLPELHDQVTTTRQEVEITAAEAEADPLDGPTVVQPAPFEELAADLADLQGTPSRPAGMRDTLPEPGPVPNLAARSDYDEDEVDMPDPAGSFALRVALTVALGVGVGVGVAVLIWYMGVV